MNRNSNNSACPVRSVVPRITFGMIVLNGEPFTRYNLRSLYPRAHQIVVVEGACKAAAAVADVKGHSTDGTLDVLRRFQAEEDPDRKLVIVTAEDEGHPDGFWPGEKHEMSQAYAKRATGNFLWQVDVDEFYRDEDMPKVMDVLRQGADALTFQTLHFWGGLQFFEDGEFMRMHKACEYHRLFRWGPGFTYATHRPPTVLDDRGQDLRSGRWIGAGELRRQRIFMYHYSMLLPKQVVEKCSYYSKVDWAAFQGMERWAQEVFFQLQYPFRICNTLHIPLSWLEEYRGFHPRQILEMVENIRAGRHPNIQLRPTDDIMRVIRMPSYRVGRSLRKLWVNFGLPLGRFGSTLAKRWCRDTWISHWRKQWRARRLA